MKPRTAAKSLQSCPTLCDPIDGSPPGSLVPGILQARTLEWVAISFSNAWKWRVKVKLLSHVWLLETPWTAAHQAPPSMGFSRQESWSGTPIIKAILKKKIGQSWRCHPPWLQMILQSCSNQNTMVLAQKHIHRSMEQNREPRNKTLHENESVSCSGM